MLELSIDRWFVWTVAIAIVSGMLLWWWIQLNIIAIDTESQSDIIVRIRLTRLTPKQCTDAKLVAVGVAADTILKCYANAVKNADAVDAECVDVAKDRLRFAFGRAESRGECYTREDSGLIESLLNAFVADIVSLARVGQYKSLCAAEKINAVAGKVSLDLKTYATSANAQDSTSKFLRAIAVAEKNNDCKTTGDAQTFASKVNAFVRNIAKRLGAK